LAIGDFSNRVIDGMLERSRAPLVTGGDFVVRRIVRFGFEGW
jgi:hypothetical protein